MHVKFFLSYIYLNAPKYTKGTNLVHNNKKTFILFYLLKTTYNQANWYKLYQDKNFN